MVKANRYYVCKARREEGSYCTESLTKRTYNDYLLSLFRFNVNDIYYSPSDGLLYDYEWSAVFIPESDSLCFKEFEFVIDESAKELIETIKKNKYVRGVLFKPTCYNESFNFTLYSCQILLKQSNKLYRNTSWCHSIDDQKKAVEAAYKLFRKMTHESNILSLAMKGAYHDLYG